MFFFLRFVSMGPKVQGKVPWTSISGVVGIKEGSLPTLSPPAQPVPILYSIPCPCLPIVMSLTTS